MAGLLVVAEHLQGNLQSITGELIGAALPLKGQLGGPLTVAVIGDGSGDVVTAANREGVDEVLDVDVGTPHFDAAIYEEALLHIGAEREPQVILIGHTATGMAYGAALAASLGSGFASDVFQLEAAGGGVVATRSAFGGKLNVELEFPNKGVVVLTLRPATFAPPSAHGNARVASTAIEVSRLEGRVRHLGYEDAPPADIDISKAEFILSVGRGIQDEQNLPRFAALAECLGATFGCSRPIVDAGWLPKAHQVGQSGTVAASCKLYLALGISGAVQHQFGMKHVETIIAVNNDPRAPIFDVATYGVNADVHEFADALESHLKSGG